MSYQHYKELKDLRKKLAEKEINEEDLKTQVDYLNGKVGEYENYQIIKDLRKKLAQNVKTEEDLKHQVYNWRTKASYLGWELKKLQSKMSKKDEIGPINEKADQPRSKSDKKVDSYSSGKKTNEDEIFKGKPVSCSSGVKVKSGRERDVNAVSSIRMKNDVVIKPCPKRQLDEINDVDVVKRSYPAAYRDRISLDIYKVDNNNEEEDDDDGECPFQLWKCSQCSKLSRFAAGLAVHMEIHYPGNRGHIKCPKNDNFYGTVQQLTEHLRAKHTKERLFQCKTCPAKLSTVGALGQHEKKHRLKHMFSQCGGCLSFYSTVAGKCKFCKKNKT